MPGDSHQDQFRGESSPDWAIPKEAYPWVARLRAGRIQPFVSPDHIVFEYGLRTGLNLSRLEARKKLALASSGPPASDLEESQIEWVAGLDAVPEGSVDIVLCHRVLEYLLDPVEAITQLQRVLKPNGTILVFALYDSEFRRPNSGSRVSHFYSWNVQTLGNLLTDSGFTVLSGTVKRNGDDGFAAKRALQSGWGEPGFRLLESLSRLTRPNFEVRLAARHS